MKKASEYRHHAGECRAMADGTKPGPQRDQLLEMARTWDNLAADREKLVRNHPELDTAQKPDQGSSTSK